jgi:hypothetical protein
MEENMIAPADCPIVEKRRVEDPWRVDITQRMVNMERQHIELRRDVQANTEICKTVETNTGEIIEFFKAGKGFFKMVGYVSVVAKWTTAILAGAAALWAAMHIGGKNG